MYVSNWLERTYLLHIVTGDDWVPIEEIKLGLLRGGFSDESSITHFKIDNEDYLDNTVEFYVYDNVALLKDGVTYRPTSDWGLISGFYLYDADTENVLMYGRFKTPVEFTAGSYHFIKDGGIRVACTSRGKPELLCKDFIGKVFDGNNYSPLFMTGSLRIALFEGDPADSDLEDVCATELKYVLISSSPRVEIQALRYVDGFIFNTVPIHISYGYVSPSVVTHAAILDSASEVLLSAPLRSAYRLHYDSVIAFNQDALYVGIA